MRQDAGSGFATVPNVPGTGSAGRVSGMRAVFRLFQLQNVRTGAGFLLNHRSEHREAEKMSWISRIGVSAAIAAAAAWGVAQAGSMQVTAQVISSGGGSSASAGACRRLHATLGEPVIGHSSGGSYSLVAGFQAGISAGPRDSVFNDGFEECK